MPDNAEKFSFRIPAAQPVEVYLVRRADGQFVARTAAELAALPAPLSATRDADAAVTRRGAEDGRTD